MMCVATKPVAWLHKTGHNEIQFFFNGIFSLHDKVLHMVLSPLHSGSIQSKHFKDFNWGWETKTCLGIRMSKPSARKSQLCNIKYEDLCCSKWFNHKISFPGAEQKRVYLATRALWRKSLCICSVVIVIFEFQRENKGGILENTLWRDHHFNYLQMILKVFC